MRFPHAIVTALLVIGVVGSAAAGSPWTSAPKASHCPPKGCPQGTQTPPPAVTKTVDVTVPAPSQASAPAPCPYFRTLPPAQRRSVPVRVQVSVRADQPRAQSCPPATMRDPGPIRPVVAHSVGLVGATIAAPFRLAEMFYERCRSRDCAPRPPVCGPIGCAPQPTKCPPAACVPSPCPPGPSIAPLPPCAPPNSCAATPPRRMSKPPKYPPCEPGSLLGGIGRLPGRVMRHGRVWGDWNSRNDCRPY